MVSTHPIPDKNIMSFNDLNLNTKILRAITDMGYVIPTPIQQEAIPKIMDKSDLMASAQTGTGKTAAFILPILDSLSKMDNEVKKGKKGGKPKALVLVPTRELAQQITKEIGNYTKYLPEIITVAVYGGVPFNIQLKSLSRNFKLLVATPGRLLDLMDRKKIDLSEIEVLIVDEADRMLDMGFVDDVKKIANSCPDERQTLMFSATLDKNVLALSKELQKDALHVKVNPEVTTAENIEQRLYYVDGLEHKMKLLEHLLTESNDGQIIVFTSTKSLADELSENLVEMGLNAAALHGDMSQRQRTRTFERLRAGKIKILVATDVAARGLDIVKLSYVVNFDIPRQPEDYVHRIGRTGRAGESGIALTFATAKDKFLVDSIERLTKQSMECHVVPGLEPKRTPKKNEERGNKNSTSNNERRGRSRRSFGRREGSRFRRRDDDNFNSEGSTEGNEKPSFKRRDRFSSEGPRKDGERSSFRRRGDDRFTAEGSTEGNERPSFRRRDNDRFAGEDSVKDMEGSSFKRRGNDRFASEDSRNSEKPRGFFNREKRFSKFNDRRSDRKSFRKSKNSSGNKRSANLFKD